MRSRKVQEALETLAQSTARGLIRSRAPGRRSLRVLHVSPRYGKVNAKVLGIQRSRNMKRKIAEGRYLQTMGMFKQEKYRKAMQEAPEATGEALQKWSLVAWDRRRGQPASYQRADGSQEALKLSLWCGETAAECFFSWCWWFGERQVGQEGAWVAETPYPVFIPTKGRPKDAHLNWRAAHCFGEEAFHATGVESDSPSALVLAVVEPAEAQAYREAWPEMPFLILPENDMGPSFARYCIQKLSTSFRAQGGGDFGPLQHMQFCWLIDDSITSFYRLQRLSQEALEDQNAAPTTPLSRPTGRKSQRCGEGAMCAQALLAAQKASKAFVIGGFLRDDGTAPMKSAQWALDSTSIFKVVLLNLLALQQLQVEYIPSLRLFEDVCLNVQARNSGGHILKCLGFCYRADNKRFGGCAPERAAKAASTRCTALEDLIPAHAFMALPSAAQAGVPFSLGGAKELRNRRLERRNAMRSGFF